MDVRRLGRYDALVLTAAIWFFAKFLRYAFPPLFATFRDAFGVSSAVLGAAYSALMVAYAAMQFPSGALADRVGTVWVIVAGALVAAVASLAVAVPAPFPALVGAMLLVGVGTGAHKTVAIRLLSAAYPARTGRAIGVLDTIAAFGGVAAPAAVTVALPRWRGVFLGSALAVLALAALFARRVPRRLPDRGAGAGRDAGLAAYAGLFADRRLLLFVPVTVAVSFAYNGVVAFLPLYLVDAGGLAPAAANLLYSGLFVVSLVQLGTGEVTDRAGTLPVLVVTVALGALGLVGLLFVGGGPVALGAAVVLFGLGGHGYRPARSTYLMDVLPGGAAAGGLGAVRTVLTLSAAVAPAVTGYLADAAGFRVAFGMLAGTMALALGLLGALWATR